MASRYGARVDIRGTIVPLPPLSIYTRRRSHLHTQTEEKLPTGSEEEQTVVKTCRPNSKRTQLSKIVVAFIQ
jgi:hypothetical protein